MKNSKWWYLVGLIVLFGNQQKCLGDTGLDGAATISSGFTLTGPIFISSVTITSATIANVVGSLNMSSNKITGLANGTVSTDAVAFSQLKIVQIVSGTNSTSNSTTSSSYQNTNLTATITPTSSSNKVLIWAFGLLQNSGNNDAAFATIARNGTNVVGTNYLAVNNTANTITYYESVNMMYLDSPATTSSTTYTVQIKDDGTHTAFWGANNQGTQSIILAEVTP